MKKVLLASMVFLACSAASAATKTLDLSGGATYFGNAFAAVPGTTTSFVDDYLFSIDAATVGDVTGTYIVGKTKTLENAAVTSISFFKVVDGTHVTIGSSFGASDFYPSALLSAGNYGFEVTGSTLLTGKAGSYSGNLSVEVTPVPEPETYGMLLGGLALLGVVARRKAKKAA